MAVTEKCVSPATCLYGRARLYYFLHHFIVLEWSATYCLVNQRFVSVLTVCHLFATFQCFFLYCARVVWIAMLSKLTIDKISCECSKCVLSLFPQVFSFRGLRFTYMAWWLIMNSPSLEPYWFFFVTRHLSVFSRVQYVSVMINYLSLALWSTSPALSLFLISMLFVIIVRNTVLFIVCV